MSRAFCKRVRGKKSSGSQNIYIVIEKVDNSPPLSFHRYFSYQAGPARKVLSAQAKIFQAHFFISFLRPVSILVRAKDSGSIEILMIVGIAHHSFGVFSGFRASLSKVVVMIQSLLGSRVDSIAEFKCWQIRGAILSNVMYSKLSDKAAAWRSTEMLILTKFDLIAAIFAWPLLAVFIFVLDEFHSNLHRNLVLLIGLELIDVSAPSNPSTCRCWLASPVMLPAVFQTKIS